MSMGDGSTNEQITAAMAEHVRTEHASPVDKHNALLTDCYAALANVASGVRVSKLNAKNLCTRIKELSPISKTVEFPSDEDLEEADEVSGVTKKPPAKKNGAPAK
ncbi:MAG TPA: hypothetical protein VKJ65_12455 [Phycisphaerae bacterium]|nr:hypothetical protein [Phycisphaerae bacterium]